MKNLICALFVALTAGCNKNVKYEYYQDGSIFLKYHINEKNQWHGEYLEFYPNGDTLLKTNYENNKLDGTFQCYYEGNIPYFTVQYEKGLLMNIQLYRLKNGTLVQEDEFKNGNGVIYVYGKESGDLLSKHSYANGLPHGMKYIFLNGGRVDSIMNDSNDIPSFAKRNFPPFD